MMKLPSWFPFQRKPVPPKARVEASFTDPQLYPPRSQWFPYNPDVFTLKKGGIQVYDRMRRDGQIKSCQGIKKLAVLCSGWDVEPQSKENVDVEVADFCKETLIDLPGTLEQIIKGILTGWDYGFSVTEKVFDYVEDGEFAGKLGISKLKTRKPHRWDFKTDEYGNLVELWQENGTYKYEPNKFIVYSHNKEFDNWYGTSDLQAVYPHWFSKDVIMRYWNMFLERFGMGIPFLHPGEGGTLSGDAYTSLRDALYNLQNNSVIATTLPNVEIDILESGRRGRDEYGQAISYHDRAIARALLMPTGLGYADDEKGSGGSLARSKKHFDIWLLMIQDVRKTVEELLNEQLLRELVDYNYNVKKHPTFKFNPIEDEDTAALAKLWLEAIEGRAVHPTPEDENRLRYLINFPERDIDDLTEDMDTEATKRPSGLPPAWPGMGWELQKTEVVPENPEAVPEKEPVPAALQPGQPPEPEKSKVIPFPPPKEHARKWHRELTKCEKRIDFAAIEKTLDALEEESRQAIVKILKKQQKKLLQKLKLPMSKRDIQNLQLPYSQDFHVAVGEFIRASFDAGRNQAQAVLAKAREKKYASPVIKMPPKQALARLREDRFWIKNVTFQALTEEIQGILINATDSGEVPAETMQKIRTAYEKYVGDPQKIQDAKQIEPYRIETLIRTNGTRAYNTGMMVEYNDPALEGFVRAVQLSAILDTRTTDICRAADGKIFLLDDPDAGKYTPPLHHQCRTVVIPITEVDGEFTPSTSLQLAEVKQLMPPDFGGSFDKVGGRARKEILGLESLQTISEIHQYAQNKFPSIQWNLKGMRINYAKELIKQLELLEADWGKNITEYIGSIEIAKTEGAWARTIELKGKQLMQFSEEMWSRDDLAEKLLENSSVREYRMPSLFGTPKTGIRPGFLVEGTNSPSVVFTHEFGHVLDDFLRNHPMLQEAHWEWLEKYSTHESIKDISIYADSKSIKEVYHGPGREAWAEAFAGIYHGTERVKNIEYVSKLEDYLDTIREQLQ